MVFFSPSRKWYSIINCPVHWCYDRSDNNYWIHKCESSSRVIDWYTHEQVGRWREKKLIFKVFSKEKEQYSILDLVLGQLHADQFLWLI